MCSLSHKLGSVLEGSTPRMGDAPLAPRVTAAAASVANHVTLTWKKRQQLARGE
jgi:hypothetical protein